MVTTCLFAAALISDFALRDRTLAVSVSPISAISSEDIGSSPNIEKFLSELDKSLKSSLANSDFPGVDRSFDRLNNSLVNIRGLGSIEVLEGGTSILQNELPIFDLEKIVVLRDVSQSLGTLFDPVDKRQQSTRSRHNPGTQPPTVANPLTDPGYTPTFQGPDMNSMQVIEPLSWKDQNPYDRLTYNLGPGTMFLPEDESYQPMVSYRPIFFESTVRFDLFAALRPQADPLASGRTLCLAMNKKSPKMGVKYLPAPCGDKVVRGLAILSSLSRSTGAQDQARMWLYTDKAGLAEINKRLVPGVVPGYYTRALRDIDKLGGFTDKDRKNKLLYPAELLFAPTGDSHAFYSLVDNMTKNFSKEMRSALEKGHNEQVNALFTSNAADLKSEHLDLMLGYLLTSENTDVKLGMLSFLEKRVPTPSRSMVKGLANFEKLNHLISDSNKAVANLATKVRSAYESE